MAGSKEGKQKTKYSEVVSSVMEEKLYFKDAIDWYCLKYVSAESERTYFVFLSFLSFLIVLFLYFTINNILPLKETFPVFIKQKDAVNYYFSIEPIKPQNMNYTSNEAMLRFLLINYTRDLFNHDYRSGNIDDLNTKLLKIKNYSSAEAYNKFREEFNQISANMFNKIAVQTVAIRTFKFLKSSKKGMRSKLTSYIISSTPTEAEITYTRYFSNSKGTTKYDGKILLTFKFDTIKYNSLKNEFTKPSLIVTDYKIIEGNGTINTSNTSNTEKSTTNTSDTNTANTPTTNAVNKANDEENNSTNNTTTSNKTIDTINKTNNTNINNN